MGCRDLIESLRKTGDSKVSGIWEAVESEAGRLHAEARERLRALRAEHEQDQAARTREVQRDVMADAHARSRKLRLAYEKKLSDRFFVVAGASLRSLRGAGYPKVFERLVMELPPLTWRLVRVNPGDVLLARRYFTNAEIVPDALITGGIDVEAGDGMIRIVNTFEKRLERAWPDMLPHMIRDAYQEVSRERSDRS